jgi:CO/xanthine dehydrogenase FAD-binding subunit
LEQLFTGYYETILQSHELITEVQVEVLWKGEWAENGR